MRPLPPDVAGPENDLADVLDHYVERAIADPSARVYAFGERWGPESARDKVFGFRPGNGVHDIHMNQGNSERFRGDDGVWQDGGLLLRFGDRWIGIFLAFQSQAWHTDDVTGHAIAAPGPEPVEDAPAALRILAAMVNPNGGAPERETVLLLNASPQRGRPHRLDPRRPHEADVRRAGRPAGARRGAERRAVERRRARQQGRRDHAARARRAEGRRRLLHRRAGASGGVDDHVLSASRSAASSTSRPTLRSSAAIVIGGSRRITSP